MSKMSIDVDLMKNQLFPAINKCCEQISIAAASSSKVSFPRGEFNWSQCTGNINSCLTNMKTYSNWIHSVCDSFVNSYNQNVEDIEAMKMSEVVKRETIVK